MKIVRDADLDVVEIIFEESDDVYGTEQFPGVIEFRDTITNKLCSVEILFFSKYPPVWQMSLESLGLGYLKELLKDLEEN